MLLANTQFTCIPNSTKSIENFNTTSKSRHLLPLFKGCTHLVQFKQVHAQIIKTSFNNKTITETQLAKLIESLVNSSQIDYARLVLNQIVNPSTFAFNTIIRGYAEAGLGHEAIRLYIQMRCKGLEPDNFTHPILLKACGSLKQGKAVHSLVAKNQDFKSEIHSLTRLITFYCGFGDIDSARLLFDKMADRNVVTWTAMINGYVKQNRYKEGIDLFYQMRNCGVEINELTLVSVLSACASLGALEMGKWVHRFIYKNRIFLNHKLGAAVIDMYAKCGYIDEASNVFKIVPEKSVCTWNSIIGGLAMHGSGEEALERFYEMQMSGIKPDDITLIAVLSACTHSGLVEKGKEIFCKMRSGYEIEPNIKHYGCFIDLLCRAGLLDEAYKVVRNMPMEPNAVLWGTLLTACAANSNVVELSETAMEHLIKLEPFNDGNYVLMSNIYAANERWDDVAKMRRLMKERRIEKNPGCSLIEINNVVHEFMVGDGRHPRSEDIYSMLEDVAISLREEGYTTQMHPIINDENKFQTFWSIW
ncbi:pentatricopeptide repeat-containing protein At5g66520-like [Pistacia vera]|uniref:pentatricopeptide repeat-containing protein At5g66520-like n=1 Tax=Pistacia vera TaxID=55513 RepID=UPI001262C27A|nr:pentatricopeptide repeat-containing protein At5g66520-like [Pistacia vera]